MSHTYDVRIFAEFKATFDIIILIIYAHNFYTRNFIEAVTSIVEFLIQ